MNTAAPTPASASPAASVAVLPAAPLADDGSAGAGLWSSLVVTLLALAFVLALAWLFLRALKYLSTPRSIDGRAPPQVVQAIALGGRERVVIVRDGAHEYVLGVTAASVSLIDKRPARDAQAPQA